MECTFPNSFNGSWQKFSLPFEEREELIATGLGIYLSNVAGDYFTGSQIDILISVLQEFRKRPENVDFSKDLWKEISSEGVIRNRFLPHKTLRKDELAILFYNLSPYALVSRICIAKIAKNCFPNFFASVSTINSTFTKYQLRQETRKGREVSLTISNFSERSTPDVETYLLELALDRNNED